MMVFTSMGPVLSMLTIIRQSTRAVQSQRISTALVAHALYKADAPNKDTCIVTEAPREPVDGSSDEPQFIRTILFHALKIGTPANPVREVLIYCNDDDKGGKDNDEEGKGSDTKVTPSTDANNVRVGLTTARLQEVAADSVDAIVDLELPLLATGVNSLTFDIRNDETFITLNNAEVPHIYMHKVKKERHLKDTPSYTPTKSDEAPVKSGMFTFGTKEAIKKTDITKPPFDVLFLVIKETRPRQIRSVKYVPQYSYRKSPTIAPVLSPTVADSTTTDAPE